MSKLEQRWEKGYAEAKAYYEIYGNLNVPATYLSPTGYKLGGWIADRRERGKEKHSAKQQARLDAIGMVWVKPDSWEVRYGFAKAYYETHGDLNIPSKYRADGIWLAKWVNEQKQIYAGKRKGKALRNDQVQRLEELGICWGKQEYGGRKLERKNLEGAGKKGCSQGTARKNIA